MKQKQITSKWKRWCGLFLYLWRGDSNEEENDYGESDKDVSGVVVERGETQGDGGEICTGRKGVCGICRRAGRNQGTGDCL